MGEGVGKSIDWAREKKAQKGGGGGGGGRTCSKEW